MSEKELTPESVTVPGDQTPPDENAPEKASEIPLRKRLLDLMLVNLKSALPVLARLPRMWR